jgi:hypothetical protein
MRMINLVATEFTVGPITKFTTDIGKMEFTMEKEPKSYRMELFLSEIGTTGFQKASEFAHILTGVATTVIGRMVNRRELALKFYQMGPVILEIGLKGKQEEMALKNSLTDQFLRASGWIQSFKKVNARTPMVRYTTASGKTENLKVKA